MFLKFYNFKEALFIYFSRGNGTLGSHVQNLGKLDYHFKIKLYKLL